MTVSSFLFWTTDYFYLILLICLLYVKYDINFRGLDVTCTTSTRQHWPLTVFGLVLSYWEFDRVKSKLSLLNDDFLVSCSKVRKWQKLHRHSGKAGYFMDVRDWLCFRAQDKEVVFKTYSFCDLHFVPFFKNLWVFLEFCPSWSISTKGFDTDFNIIRSTLYR